MPRRRLLLGAARAALFGLVAVPLLYVVAAVIGSLVPRNAGWREPAEGVQIFLRSNGVHVDLVLPARAQGFDLYRLLPPGHVADPRAAQGWIGLGWGQREVYLETPQWRDLTLRNAVRATLGGGALMHVDHVGAPQPSADTRPVRLEPAAYRRLVAAALADFVRGRDGRPIPLPGRGYGIDDVFYEAGGRYSALRPSNQWTADALAQAGVRVGVWTPFAQGILWRF